MAVYQASVSKKFSWRGVDEVYSNVYTMKHDNPGEADFIALLGDLVDGEKQCFDTNTTFLSGRVWGPIVVPGDGISEEPNQTTSTTQYIADFSGTGALVPGVQFYRELAVMISAYIGRNPATGRKRFLRKYYHTTFNASFGTTDIQQGTEFSTTIQTNIRNKFVDNLVTSPAALGWDHCAMNGDTPQEPWVVNRRLRIRQLRQ